MTTPTMGAVWIVYTLIAGSPLPTLDSPQFTTESACRLFIYNNFTEEVVDTFKLVCGQK